MNNVVRFQPRRAATNCQNVADLIGAVAHHRRHPDDVFWLKECAELLNILNAIGNPIAREALAPFEAFYDGIEERLQFFPQYYRFMLSMVLDLEDLGLPGSKGSSICQWVARAGLAEAELSDLQRAEAQLLLSRRGAGPMVREGAVGQRLAQFAERPDTFALPNKKAAYELTHIVFYLSEYGKVDPGLSAEALRSLEYSGLIAYLDQNHDLLAEICTALRFAGIEPSEIWTDAVATAHQAIRPVVPQANGAAADAYHAYMVTGWAQAVAKARYFTADFPPDGVQFIDQTGAAGALRPLSQCLYDMGEDRRASWSKMRDRVMPQLPHASREVLSLAEASSPEFERFFEGFSRASGG